MSKGILTFPEAEARPLSLERLVRAWQIMQLANQFTVPTLTTLPATGLPNQLVAVGGTLYFWDTATLAWVSLVAAVPGDLNAIRGGPELTLPASGLVTTGHMVNVFDDSGTLKARLADNSSITTRAHAFAKGTATDGNPVTIKFWMGVAVYSIGVTPGTDYYLGTSGTVTDTPPSGGSTIVQYVGVANGPTAIAVDINDIESAGGGGGSGDQFFNY